MARPRKISVVDLILVKISLMTNLQQWNIRDQLIFLKLRDTEVLSSFWSQEQGSSLTFHNQETQERERTVITKLKENHISSLNKDPRTSSNGELRERQRVETVPSRSALMANNSSTFCQLDLNSICSHAVGMQVMNPSSLDFQSKWYQRTTKWLWHNLKWWHSWEQLFSALIWLSNQHQTSLKANVTHIVKTVVFARMASADVVPCSTVTLVNTKVEPRELSRYSFSYLWSLLSLPVLVYCMLELTWRRNRKTQHD